jgi:hypothetical protein
MNFADTSVMTLVVLLARRDLLSVEPERESLAPEKEIARAIHQP